MESQLVKERLVKVEIELSALEIEMFLNCVGAAIDTGHVQGRDLQRAREIKRQLSRYL